jgi:hypothetical protein
MIGYQLFRRNLDFMEISVKKNVDFQKRNPNSVEKMKNRGESDTLFSGLF